jgi:hypothetical protein
MLSRFFLLPCSLLPAACCLLRVATILWIDRLILAPLSFVSDSPRDQDSASEESARTLLPPAQRMTLVLAPLLVPELRCTVLFC